VSSVSPLNSVQYISIEQCPVYLHWTVPSISPLYSWPV
jgi:hypothetical protein